MEPIDFLAGETRLKPNCHALQGWRKVNDSLSLLAWPFGTPGQLIVSLVEKQKGLLGQTNVRPIAQKTIELEGTPTSWGVSPPSSHQLPFSFGVAVSTPSTTAIYTLLASDSNVDNRSTLSISVESVSKLDYSSAKQIEWSPWEYGVLAIVRDKLIDITWPGHKTNIKCAATSCRWDTKRNLVVLCDTELLVFTWDETYQTQKIYRHLLDVSTAALAILPKLAQDDGVSLAILTDSKATHTARTGFEPIIGLQEAIYVPHVQMQQQQIIFLDLKYDNGSFDTSRTVVDLSELNGMYTSIIALENLVCVLGPYANRILLVDKNKRSQKSIDLQSKSVRGAAQFSADSIFLLLATEAHDRTIEETAEQVHEEKLRASLSLPKPMQRCRVHTYILQPSRLQVEDTEEEEEEQLAPSVNAISSLNKLVTMTRSSEQQISLLRNDIRATSSSLTASAITITPAQRSTREHGLSSVSPVHESQIQQLEKRLEKLEEQQSEMLHMLKAIMHQLGNLKLNG